MLTYYVKNHGQGKVDSRFAGVHHKLVLHSIMVMDQVAQIVEENKTKQLNGTHDNAIILNPLASTVYCNVLEARFNIDNKILKKFQMN